MPHCVFSRVYQSTSTLRKVRVLMRKYAVYLTAQDMQDIIDWEGFAANEGIGADNDDLIEHLTLVLSMVKELEPNYG